MQHYDAIIVGGGVAGAFAALRLVRAKWQVALIEKGMRNRHKACGHCLHQRCFPVLERAGILDQVKAAATARTRAVRIHDGGARWLHAGFADDDHGAEGLVISRHELDQLIIDRAAEEGARVFQSTSAQLILNQRARAHVHVHQSSQCFQMRAPLVIGADGVGSAVARTAGLASRASAGRNYGCSFSIKSPVDLDAKQGTIELFLTRGGYLGMVGSGADHLHIAMRIAAGNDMKGVRPLQFLHQNAKCHERLRMIGLHKAQSEDLRDFCATGPFPWRPSRVATDRIALIGDAAGYIEPFTGEGMTWALHSADALCSILMQARPGTWNSIMAREYARRWKKLLSRRHALCQTFAAAMHSRRIAGMCLGAARRTPALTNHLVRMVVSA